MSTEDAWTVPQLRQQLRDWERLLRERGYPESTVKTYVGRSEIFVRWLAGEWEPTGPRS